MSSLQSNVHDSNNLLLQDPVFRRFINLFEGGQYRWGDIDDDLLRRNGIIGFSCRERTAEEQAAVIKRYNPAVNKHLHNARASFNQGVNVPPPKKSKTNTTSNRFAGFQDNEED